METRFTPCSIRASPGSPRRRRSGPCGSGRPACRRTDAGRNRAAAIPARLLKKLLASSASFAQETEGAAAELVRPRLGLEVDDAAQRPAELGGVGARLELELVERVDAREDHDAASQVSLLSTPSSRKLLSRGRWPFAEKDAEARQARPPAPSMFAPGDAPRHPGDRPGQAHEVPAVQGQGLDLRSVQGGAQVGGRRLHQRVLGLDQSTDSVERADSELRSTRTFWSTPSRTPVTASS